MNKKGIIIGLAIVLLIGGAVLVMRKEKGTPTVNQPPVVTVDPENTADWKTYRNEEFGFEVKYPQDWTIVGDGSATSDNINKGIYWSTSISSPDTTQLYQSGRSDGDRDITFTYVEDFQDSRLNPNKYRTLDELIAKENYLTGLNKIQLSGADAFEYTRGGNGAYYVISTIHNSHYFEIWFWRKEMKSNLTPMEQTIVNTFHFTK